MASAFSDPLAPSPCEQCGNDTEGTMRCSVQDSKNLCQGCFQDLPQARREDIGDPEWVCDVHLNNKVDIFCETCQLGCCKECAVDVHQGHKVVNVFQLGEEIRRNLTEQLQEVGVRAETLLELRRDIESSRGKIEEAPKLVDKVVDEIKKQIAQNLEKEILSINLETQLKIKRVTQEAVLDIQRIEEIQHCISTGLQEDAEKRKCKIQKAESILLVGQQACESANLHIKSVLESIPEELVCEGRRLCSFAKASLAFQCQNDVLGSCREVEADLPKLKMEKGHFFLHKGLRPSPPIVELLVCILFILFFANNARGFQRDQYNDWFSSESMLFFSMCHAMKCFLFTCILTCTMSEDYPIKRKESSAKDLKHFIKMVQFGLEFWLLTVLVFILVSSPLNFFQVKLVSANIGSIISILQSCTLLYGMRNSKAFKDYCDYLKLCKI